MADAVPAPYRHVGVDETEVRMKKTTYSQAIKSKYPEPVALAVSTDKKNGRANIITLGWSMCTSFEPPMLAISVGHTRYSHKTIRECGEFVLAFPSEDQAEAALLCGTCSGEDRDKFRDSGLQAIPASRVGPPLVAGACANFECKVIGSCESGDHTVFVGEVLASHVSERRKARLYSMSDGSLQGIPG
jgi:flavin reductase (DIM6/NTAB) family NADH-FMN oxidoreductase RutF